MGTGLDTAPDRLMSKVAKPDREDGCWLYQGAKTAGGYAQILVGGKWGKQVYVHRLSYELFVGPIPEGLDLDHLCRTRNCINPSHLEPVTHAENMARSVAAITRCVNGHPYKGSNLHIARRGHRECRTCRRERMARCAPLPGRED
jgi:hypothetical protein